MSDLIGWELVSKYAGEHDDPGDAVRAMFADLRLNKGQSAALFAIVLEAVSNRQRLSTMAVERRVKGLSKRRGLGQSHDAVQARKELAEEFFAVGDGRRVRWGAATVADHRERIEMLERNRRGLAATIALHAEAIAVIEAAGVACLDDIEEAA